MVKYPTGNKNQVMIFQNRYLFSLENLFRKIVRENPHISRQYINDPATEIAIANPATEPSLPELSRIEKNIAKRMMKSDG